MKKGVASTSAWAGLSGEMLFDPRMQPFWKSVGALNLRGHADHEKPTQVAATFLADPTQLILLLAALLGRV